MKATPSTVRGRASIESLLLTAITRAQSQFVLSHNARTVFDGLLDALLRLTDSAYGFIGEVLHTADDTQNFRVGPGRVLERTIQGWRCDVRRYYEEEGR